MKKYEPILNRKLGEGNRHQEMLYDVHTDREKKRKEALAKSPKIRKNDLIKVESLHNCYIQFKKGVNKAKALENFIAKHNEIYL